MKCVLCIRTIGEERMSILVYDTGATKRPVNLTLNTDLVARAREEGLNLSALAEDAIAAEMARRHRAKWDALVAQDCKAHEEYLKEHGSLGDILRANAEADGE
jgi:antitoxin CcdA